MSSTLPLHAHDDETDGLFVPRAQHEALCARLEEAEQMLRAIRNGEVDALVVHGQHGDQIYTLRSADEPYRILIEQMQEAALTLSSEGAILYCNQFFARLVGREHSEVIGRYLSEFLAAADDSMCAELLRRAAGEPTYVRARLRDAEGRSVPVKLALNALRGKGFEGLCGVITDLTSQEEKDRAVAAERLTSAVLEATSDAVLVCDDTGTIIRTNEKAKNYFGPDCLQRAIDDLCRFERPFADLVQTRPDMLTGIELRHVRNDVTVHLWGGIRRLNDPDLGVSGWVVTLADITRQKDMECAARESEARFRQLATELERQAQQLQEADRRKDEFLAVLGHELRNPLAGIANGVTLLKRGARTAEQVSWTYNMIGDQVVQLTRLLNDLLDVARITHGKIHLHDQLLDIRPLVEAAVASASRLIDTRGHELSMALPPQPLWVRGDSVRIEQIVVNLLTNAAKYTERNGKIALELDADAENVYVRVRDNGVGIAADMLEHIFEPFRQLQTPGRAATEGLGIGLTLARRLVELHGGSIDVTSGGPGGGSEFVVRLPQARPRAVPAAGRPESAAPVLPAGTRILIVDDNADTARGLALLLQGHGCDVETVYDGASALAAAPRYRPHTVLLDIGLPDIDGCEVARQLRASDALRDVLLVAISGFGGRETQQRAAAAGFDHYLVKPVNFHALLGLCSARPTVDAR